LERKELRKHDGSKEKIIKRIRWIKRIIDKLRWIKRIINKARWIKKKKN
jgi:hypothetical protein